MDETVARRIDYRVIRPGGKLIWTHAASSAEGWVPTARRDGSFAPPGSPDSVAPPFLIQRLDGDDWVTIETSCVRYALPPEDNAALGVRLHEALMEVATDHRVQERIVLTFLRDGTELSQVGYTPAMLWFWIRDIPADATHVTVETSEV